MDFHILGEVYCGMSDVEDGTWLSFTWQRRGAMDEILVFALCMGYRRLVNFLPVWQGVTPVSQVVRGSLCPQYCQYTV